MTYEYYERLIKLSEEFLSQYDMNDGDVLEKVFNDLYKKYLTHHKL